MGVKTISLLGFYGSLIVAAILHHHVLQNSFTPSSLTIQEVHYKSSDHQNDTNIYSPHQLIRLGDTIQERIKNTNSSFYTWVGQHWMPPSGVPTFTPQELKSYYSQRNVLILGDSTGRRLYTTLYDIMNATDLNDIKNEEIDDDRYKFEMVINKDNFGRNFLSLMKQGDHYVCNNSTVEADDTQGTPQKQFKFDFKYSTCYASIYKYWQEEEESYLTSLTQDYDLIIVTAGVWEYVNAESCDSLLPNTTSSERVQLLLESIERKSPQGLQVAFRTSGFARGYGHGSIQYNNNITRQFFHDLDQSSEFGRYGTNMTLVDWGGVLFHRSLGEDRISGDRAAHYGLEARLLGIQQLTHELIKSELVQNEMKSKPRS